MDDANILTGQLVEELAGGMESTNSNAGTISTSNNIVTDNKDVSTHDDTRIISTSNNIVTSTTNISTNDVSGINSTSTNITMNSDEKMSTHSDVTVREKSAQPVLCLPTANENTPQPTFSASGSCGKNIPNAQNDDSLLAVAEAIELLDTIKLSNGDNSDNESVGIDLEAVDEYFDSLK